MMAKIKSPVAEFNEFDRRFKFKPRLKYGWFHLKCFKIHAGVKFKPQLKFFKFHLWIHFWPGWRQADWGCDVRSVLLKVD